MITAAQIMAARKLLGWKRDQLARQAGISMTTLKKVEEGWSALSPDQSDELQRVLESGGVQFTTGDQPSVRLKAKGKTPK